MRRKNKLNEFIAKNAEQSPTIFEKQFVIKSLETIINSKLLNAKKAAIKRTSKNDEGIKFIEYKTFACKMIKDIYKYEMEDIDSITFDKYINESNSEHCDLITFSIFMDELEQIDKNLLTKKVFSFINNNEENCFDNGRKIFMVIADSMFELLSEHEFDIGIPFNKIITRLLKTLNNVCNYKPKYYYDELNNNNNKNDDDDDDDGVDLSRSKGCTFDGKNPQPVTTFKGCKFQGNVPIAPKDASTKPPIPVVPIKPTILPTIMPTRPPPKQPIKPQIVPIAPIVPTKPQIVPTKPQIVPIVPIVPTKPQIVPITPIVPINPVKPDSKPNNKRKFNMENSKYTQHNNQPNSNNKRKNVTTDQLEQ
jgi:hypothetical protein